MNRQDRNMEELFRTLFEHFTVNPTPGLWNKVRTRIVWKQFLTFSLNTFNIYYLALAIIFAGAGIYFFFPRTDHAEIPRKNEITPPVDVILPGPDPAPVKSVTNPAGGFKKEPVLAASPLSQKPVLKTTSTPTVRQEMAADIPKKVTAKEEDRTTPEQVPPSGSPESRIAFTAKAKEIRVSADFTASPLSGCSPLAVNFRNLSVNTASVNWNFGDGGNSAESDPSYVFDEAGEFLVTLKVRGKDGLEYTRQQQVTVFERPKALFEFDEDVKPAINQPVYFYNYSRGGDHFEWDFGDNQRSYLQDPIHCYQRPGNYHVKLKVWTDHHCYDSLVIYNAFTTQEQRIKVPNAFTPNLDGPTGGYYDMNDFSNTVFHPVAEGELLEFQLKVFNRKGVLLFESNDISIGWDGYYNEQLMKQDVYIWKIRGKFNNGKTFVKSGDVTLIKQY